MKVFLDIDDTLVNHSQAQNEAIDKMQQKYFPQEPKTPFNLTWRFQTIQYWKLFEKKELTFEGQQLARIESVWQAFGKRIEKDEATGYINEYVRYYERALKPNTPLIDFIKATGYPLGIITNGDSDQQRRKISLTGLKIEPELVLISSEVGLSKPDDRMFKLAEQKAQVKPQKLIMIGDDMEKDIIPAKNRGWLALRVGTFEENMQR